MFPPVPAAFAGSVPQDFAPPEHAKSARLARLLDVSLTGLALLAGAAACVGAQIGGGGMDGADLVKLACAATLVPGMLGLWLMERAQEAPTLAVTQIFNLIQQRLQAEAGPGAAPRRTENGPYAGLAGLIADSVANLRQLQAGRARMAAAGAVTNQALHAGRDQAGQVADRLRSDASAMAEAASGIMAASAGLAEDAATARAASDAAEHAVNQVVDKAAGLTATIGALTAQIAHMAAMAASAAEGAFAAQSGVAGLDEKTRAMATLTARLEHTLRNAPALTQQAAAPLSGELAASFADLHATVAALREEAGVASQRLAGLAELIHGQHALGLTLGQAVERQGSEVAEVLALLQTAHDGFARLRDGVAAVTRQGTARMAEAEAVRGAANRLPAHADTIASILRAIPDFTALK